MKRTFAWVAFIGIGMAAINSNAQSASITNTEKSIHHDKDHHRGNGHHKGIHLFHHGYRHHGKHSHPDHGEQGNHYRVESKHKQRSNKK